MKKITLLLASIAIIACSCGTAKEEVEIVDVDTTAVVEVVDTVATVVADSSIVVE